MNKILLGLVPTLGTWAFMPAAVAAVSVSIQDTEVEAPAPR